MAANFEYYKIFYYVAKYQNFTLAAKALLSSQPSVSRCMQALETELGCRLFVRTKRGVSLTAEGEQLYKYVAPACEQIFKGEENIGGPTLRRFRLHRRHGDRPPLLSSQKALLFSPAVPRRPPEAHQRAPRPIRWQI